MQRAIIALSNIILSVTHALSDTHSLKATAPKKGYSTKKFP